MDDWLKIVRTVLLLVITVAVVVVAIKYLLDDDDGGLVIDPNASQIVGSGSTPEVNIDEIKYINYESMSVIFGSREANICIINPTENSVNFVVSIVLESGEEIYRSGILPPGYELRGVELNKTLGIGVYEAEIVYSAYDGSGNEVSRTSFEVKIVVG